MSSALRKDASWADEVIKGLVLEMAARDRVSYCVSPIVQTQRHSQGPPAVCKPLPVRAIEMNAVRSDPLKWS